MKKLALILVVLSAIVRNASAQELSAADLDRRRVQLRKLLDEQWEYSLRSSPEFASILGDRRYNAEVSDVSERAILAEEEDTRRFLKRFQAIDTRAFSEQEQLNRDLMVRSLRQSLGWGQLFVWQMPVNQMGGIHLGTAQLPSMLPFATVKDYDDYVARLGKWPRSFDDTIARMRKGMAAKRMPPKFLLEKVTTQAMDIADDAPEKSPFALPLEKMPDEFSAADKDRIRTAVLEQIRTRVLPSYAKFAAFVRDEYAPRGRTDVGVWALPNGEQHYAFLVQNATTTDLTAAQIHDIGVREVARIEGEMLSIAKKLGFNDLKSFNASLETNTHVAVASGEQILSAYRKYTDQMYARLPELFGRLPKAKMEVVPTPAFREANASGAEYNTGSPDGSRPGRVYVNTYEATKRKTLSQESTAYHEGVPGHHMQLSIQQELTDLPPFRQQGGETAFVEGWALYSERLGEEVGFYQDPYSDYGRLNDEMLRAIRLVVDTGLHSKRWTREQVVQYFRDHSAIDEVEIQSETDRYIVWPGQALAYKIGQLKIVELRERAQKALGAKFDIRAFHDELLGAGALPLDLLEERMDRWVAHQRTAPPHA
ncbi:MAG TPA: DUF885 domain-containing protein [Thermoanaerobaculia bacterium]|jgi:uncharacterized protein (DUF885 family)|nr:DUF885 domain-containing protein [Thermoanaerobaculia bacterium]